MKFGTMATVFRNSPLPHVRTFTPHTSQATSYTRLFHPIRGAFVPPEHAAGGRHAHAEIGANSQGVRVRGCRAIALCGMFTGGLTFTHEGELLVALSVQNT
jgi:hypothetical protein